MTDNDIVTLKKEYLYSLKLYDIIDMIYSLSPFHLISLIYYDITHRPKQKQRSLI